MCKFHLFKTIYTNTRGRTAGAEWKGQRDTTDDAVMFVRSLDIRKWIASAQQQSFISWIHYRTPTGPVRHCRFSLHLFTVSDSASDGRPIACGPSSLVRRGLPTKYRRTFAGVQRSREFPAVESMSVDHTPIPRRRSIMYGNKVTIYMSRRVDRSNPNYYITYTQAQTYVDAHLQSIDRPALSAPGD